MTRCSHGRLLRTSRYTSSSQGNRHRTEASRASTAGFETNCLNEHAFPTIFHARRAIEDWREDYNRNRPHSSLGGLTPHEFLEHYSKTINSRLPVALMIGATSEFTTFIRCVGVVYESGSNGSYLTNPTNGGEPSQVYEMVAEISDGLPQLRKFSECLSAGPRMSFPWLAEMIDGTAEALRSYGMTLATTESEGASEIALARFEASAELLLPQADRVPGSGVRSNRLR